MSNTVQFMSLRSRLPTLGFKKQNESMLVEMKAYYRQLCSKYGSAVVKLYGRNQSVAVHYIQRRDPLAEQLYEICYQRDLHLHLYFVI